MRRIALILSLVFATPQIGFAQDRTQTLADIRQEMSVLYVEIQRLKRELSTTGGVQGNLGGGSALQRMDAIEQQLQRLTQKTETLEFRINRVVTDGTNQLGDLQFRLCELQTDCDISQLPEQTVLGGGELPVAAVPKPDTAGDGAELAVGEQADYERASAAFDAGEYRTAADQLSAFTQTYPGGPLTGQAHYLRGESLAALGETAPAARAYLESFSGTPDGPRAPDALFKLGVQLADLGQSSEACVTLGEVGARFPASKAASDAQEKRLSIGCN